MLYQIASLLLEVVGGLIVWASLLRLYMQYQHIPMSRSSGNPMAEFVFAITNWLVLPLRRVVPTLGRWDTACLIAAYLVQLVLRFALWLLSVAYEPIASVPVYAAFDLPRTAIFGSLLFVGIYAILGWAQLNSSRTYFLERLVLPLLAPIRRVLHPIGGVDLSPLAFGVLMVIGLMLLEWLQGAALLLVSR